MSAIAEAASVLLTRGPGSPEVLLVARAPTLRFFGGFHAFPGGKVHPSDADLARSDAGLTPKHVAAIRELFEETGVLIARRPDGTFPRAGEPLAGARRQLLAEETPFRDLLGRLDLRLRAADLAPAGALVTPSFAPVRFDTAFFVAHLPPGQEAEIWPGELTAATWHSTDSALSAWEAGACLVSPPTVSILESLRGRPIDELPARLRPLLEVLATGALSPIWFSPAVMMVPLHCHGLAPATHTNAYLVGTGPTYLLDPGPVDPAEQQRLFELLDARQAVAPLAAVVLTHHHPDHTGAAAACAERYRVPLLAHPLTAQYLRGRLTIARELHEGDRLDAGPAPSGQGRVTLEAIHTPGHAAGHLAFHEPSYQLLFVGDMVSTVSSIIVAPPDGDLTTYLASLRRLQSWPARLLLPAHGPPSTRAAFVLEEALAHRAKREQQLLDALRPEPRSVADLALELYRGLPADRMPWAELQLLAGLHKLEREGRASPAGPGWRRTDLS